MPKGFLVANVLGFQAVWFASVIGAGKGVPWLGPVVAIAYVATHLRFSPTRQADLHLLAAALLLGVVVDSAFAASGILLYASPWPSAMLAPAWILAMWAGFALTLNHSMGFLRDRPVAIAAFGALGGPLAYWGAATGFDAVGFANLPLAIGALALAWALAMLALYAVLRASRRADATVEPTA